MQDLAQPIRLVTPKTSRMSNGITEVRVSIPQILRSRGAERIAFLEDVLTHERVINLHIGPRDEFVTADPAFAKHILVDNARRYAKGLNYDALRPLLGNGLLTSEGKTWKRARRLMQPVFQPRPVAELIPKMQGCLESMCARWDDALVNAPTQTVNMAEEMMRVTLDVVGQTLFSASFERDAKDVGRQLSQLLILSNDRMLKPFPWLHRLPTPNNLNYATALRGIETWLKSVIEERRRTEPRQDLLQMLLDARDGETGTALTTEQIRDEAMTLVLAGHETTANWLSWTLPLLSRHPEWRQRVREEVDGLIDNRQPSLEQLRAMTLTRAVLQESLRLHPPIWIIGRRALEDDRFGDIEIPKGKTVAVCIQAMHRHPTYWSNPQGFDPERFIREPETAHKPHYIPFGSGPRVCIGNHFAMLEATLILARIIQRYDVDLAPGHILEPEVAVVSKPRGGVTMTLRARRQT